MSTPQEARSILELPIIPLLPFLRLGQKSPEDQERLDRIEAGEVPNSKAWFDLHGVPDAFAPLSPIAGRWLFNDEAEAESYRQEFQDE